jgi:DNA-binding CsgD family transcriptional regulator
VPTASAVQLAGKGGEVLADPSEVLTQRQLEYIAMFASGADYTAIAAAKFVSYYTVRNVLERARANVGAASFTHLCVLALEAGLIERNGVGYKPVVDPYVAE